MHALFDTRYYYLTKLFCSIVGLWPYQLQIRRKIIHSLHVLICFSFLPVQVKRLQQVWGKDMDAVCMCLPPIFMIIGCLGKAITVILFESEMKMLLRQVETEWEVTSREKENTLLTFYALKTRILCIAYASLLSYGVMSFVIAPTITPILDIVLSKNETRVKSLGFELDYGIDIQKYWFWLWLHSSVTTVVVIFNIIATDLLFITFTIHTCYLFAIVRHELEHITDTFVKRNFRSFGVNSNIKYNLCQYEEQQMKLKQTNAVKKCVLNHQKAIEWAQLLNDIYTWSIFIGAGVNVIGISILAIQLVSKMFQWAEMMMSAVFVFGMMIHLFFLSLMAQLISNESLNVHESTYSGSWYNMSPMVQKDIVLILIRSSTPCHLMAGHLFVMSLEGFCSILQTSMSYFTVLASFR